MKVLLATHLKPVFHGQATIARQLRDGAKQWEDIELFTLNTVYAQKRGDLGKGSFGKIWKMLIYGREIRSLVRKHEIDAVILTPSFFLGSFLKDAWMIRTLKKHTSVKIIGWVHMDPNRIHFENRNPLVQKLICKVVSQVDVWVGCANSLLEGWPPFVCGKKVAISNGIGETDEQLSVATDKQGIIVTYLSAMDEEKGWRELLRVAKKICADYPQVIFKFYGGIGGVETKEKVLQAFSNTGFEDRILWLGRVGGEQKNEALADSDVFVLPSHTEQFPISVLEAMSYALPVVATDVGAIRDALPDQELIKVGDIAALEKQISMLIENEEHRHTQGDFNRQRFSSLYTEKKFIENWYQFLKESKL